MSTWAELAYEGCFVCSGPQCLFTACPRCAHHVQVQLAQVSPPQSPAHAVRQAAPLCPAVAASAAKTSAAKPSAAKTSILIGAKDPILIIKQFWLDKIEAGEKSIEIRGSKCTSKLGREFLMSASDSCTVTSKAHMLECIGPLTLTEYNNLRSKHCVPARWQGKAGLPYAETYAWVLGNVERVRPHAFKRKRGSVVWQVGPGRG